MTLIGCGRDRGINQFFWALLFNGQMERIAVLLPTILNYIDSKGFYGDTKWIDCCCTTKIMTKKYKLQSQVTIWQNALSFGVDVLLLFPSIFQLQPAQSSSSSASASALTDLDAVTSNWIVKFSIQFCCCSILHFNYHCSTLDNNNI